LYVSSKTPEVIDPVFIVKLDAKYHGTAPGDGEAEGDFDGDLDSEADGD